MKFQQWLISDETKESIYNLHKKLYEAARESKKAYRQGNGELYFQVVLLFHT